MPRVRVRDDLKGRENLGSPTFFTSAFPNGHDFEKTFGAPVQFQSLNWHDQIKFPSFRKKADCLTYKLQMNFTSSD